MKNYTRHGFVSMKRLAHSIIDDLQLNGFDLIYPLAFTNDVCEAVLQTTIDVNPVANATPNQNWRIKIQALAPDEGTPLEAQTAIMRVWAGTNLQISDLGEVSSEYIDTTLSQERKSGELTIGRFDSGSIKYMDEFIPFFSYDGAEFSGPYFSEGISDTKAHPMSYSLSITDHGISLFTWIDASDSMGNKFSWFAIQNLVDRTTGVVDTASKCPVFCMYSIGGGNPLNTPAYPELDPYQYGVVGTLPAIYRFTVREADVYRPTTPVCACIHTIDSNAVINPYQQASIYENKTFALTTPGNFNTDRYTYKDEFDMLMYTSADVIGQWSSVSLTMYGKTRDYMAMHANLPSNAGMRLMMLTGESA